MRVIQRALTFDDVLLVPAHSRVLPRDVSLKTRLTRKLELNMPQALSTSNPSNRLKFKLNNKCKFKLRLKLWLRLKPSSWHKLTDRTAAAASLLP